MQKMPKSKTGKNIKCPICGTVKYIPVCRIKKVNYCSKKCFYSRPDKQTNSGRTHFKIGQNIGNQSAKGNKANRTSFVKGSIPWNKGQGLSSEEQKMRWSAKYEEWRTGVFKRDNYTCVLCGAAGGKLNAHHLIYWSKRPTAQDNTRFDRENGLTLCIKCHKEVHTNKYKKQWCCRWSPTLGELESTHEKTWGTRKYTAVDKYNPTIFFGIYSLQDFYVLWRHQGRRCVLWAGSDILRLLNGYWLDDRGDIRVNPKDITGWINKYCENYVENLIEQNVLAELGINSTIIPSFLGDVRVFEVSYKPSKRPKVYASVSGDNFEQYGWNMIPKLAHDNPNIEFNLYGNIKPFVSVWKDEYQKNVIVHGRIPKERMNEEIKHMQGALRLTEFDGASEIIVKAMLWGQYAFSLIGYPGVNKVTELNLLKTFTKPNISGRNWWLDNLNKYPWNKNV